MLCSLKNLQVKIDQKVAVIIDATRSTGKVSVRQESVEELFGKGYKIYRKK